MVVVLIEKYLIMIIFVICLTVNNSFATEPVMITISEAMTQVNFDGKWSSETEWKKSSLTTINYDDGSEIQLRTAHQNNFMYIFIDVISDIHLDKKIDRSVVCLDGKNDKTVIANDNDYCFIITFDENETLVLQGGSEESKNHFENILTPTGFIGVSNSSDENDRYSSIPHLGYELRIPTDLVGRTDVYGFYFAAYDAHSNKIYTWPQEVTTDNILDIPSPVIWGEIISPDKSLPEYQIPILILILGTILSLFINSRRFNLFYKR